MFSLKKVCFDHISIESLLSKSLLSLIIIATLVYLNGNNAAEGENNIKYANSYPMYWTMKNWFVQYFKKGMVTTQMSGVITIAILLYVLHILTSPVATGFQYWPMMFSV